MSLNLEEKFKTHCNTQNLELNPNQITLVKQLDNFYKENFHSSFLSDEEKEYLFKNIESINLEKGSMIINDLNVSDIAFIHKK